MAKLGFAGFNGFSFIPFPPSGQITETFEFLTDIVLTHDGSEDRTANRTVARQSFAYDIPANLLTAQGPFNLAYQNIRGNWAVPIWTDAQFVGNASGTSIAVDTQVSRFKTGELVLFYQNEKTWKVAQILSVQPSGILLTASLDLIRNAFAVPIAAGIVSGDVETPLIGYDRAFRFNFDLLDPTTYPTKIAPLFALDVSNSMNDPVTGFAITRLDLAKAQIVETLEGLRGAIENSNVEVDLAICFWSTSAINHFWFNANTADIDEAIALVNSRTVTGGTTPLIPFQYANDLFGTISPNPGDRKDIVFYITDAGASTTAAAAEAEAMINREPPFDGYAEVDIYAINIDVSSTTEALKVDNASNGQITVANAANLNAMFLRFKSAIEPVIGMQYRGYEVLTLPPLHSSGEIAKQVSKIEDRVDFDLGRFEVRSPWANARLGSSHSYATDDLDEALSFKRFLYRRVGKAGGFYLPTYQHDLRFTSLDASGTYGFIGADDYDAYSDGRRDFAFRFTDGSWQALRITTVTETVLGDLRLDFDTVVEKPLSEIEYACYIGIARFDTDRHELQWIGNQATETAINIMELSA